MKRYGLIGYPLDHSFSQRYFTEKFRREGLSHVAYQNFPISSIEDLSQVFIKHPDLCGFNVTIPYKSQIIQLLDKMDTHANSIGAVNTVNIKNGQLLGFNTDWIGFINSIQPILTMDTQKVLVLGTGGSSKAIVYALKTLGLSYTLVSRNPKEEQIGYDSIDAGVMASHQLIVNCTPTGTYPDIEKCPALPYSFLSEKHVLYDLVYNPELSLFLQQGKKMGASIQNGYAMLVSQAEAAWKIWNDQ